MSNSESTKQPGGEDRAGGAGPQKYTLTLTQTEGEERPVTILIEVVNDSIHQLSAVNSEGDAYDVLFYLRKRKGAKPDGAGVSGEGPGGGGGQGGGGGGGDDDDDDDDDGGDECKFCTVVNGVTRCTAVPCPQ